MYLQYSFTLHLLLLDYHYYSLFPYTCLPYLSLFSFFFLKSLFFIFFLTGFFLSLCSSSWFYFATFILDLVSPPTYFFKILFLFLFLSLCSFIWSFFFLFSTRKYLTPITLETKRRKKLKRKFEDSLWIQKLLEN